MVLLLNPASHSRIELGPLVQGILDGVALCTMATVNQDGTAHVNTAFFCADSEWRMFFVSDDNTRHSQNINERSSIALAVFRSDQDWDDWKTGLQLFGTCEIAQGGDAELGARLIRRDSRPTPLGCKNTARRSKTAAGLLSTCLSRTQ